MYVSYVSNCNWTGLNMNENWCLFLLYKVLRTFFGKLLISIN